MQSVTIEGLIHVRVNENISRYAKIVICEDSYIRVLNKLVGFCSQFWNSQTDKPKRHAQENQDPSFRYAPFGMTTIEMGVVSAVAAFGRYSTDSIKTLNVILDRRIESFAMFS